MNKKDKTQNVKRTRRYVNQLYQELTKQPDIKDILIMNGKGNPVETTMNDLDALQHAGMYGTLLEKSKYFIQLMDPIDEVLSLRVRTTKHEILITPDEKITVLIIQDPIDKMQRFFIN